MLSIKYLKEELGGHSLLASLRIFSKYLAHQNFRMLSLSKLDLMGQENRVTTEQGQSSPGETQVR